LSVRLRVAILSVYLAALLFAGCSGGATGGGTPTNPTPPTATAKPTSMPSPTLATFQLGALPSTVKSAAVIFSTGPLKEASFPSACPASPSCSITVPAPAPTSATGYRVYVYPTTDGSGTALEIATGVIGIVPGQDNMTAVSTFYSVVDSYTLSVSPATITAQIATSIVANVIEKDVTGAIISSQSVTKDGSFPAFEVSVSESDGTTTMTGFGRAKRVSASTKRADVAAGDYLGTYYYSGIAPYPTSFTSNVYGVNGSGSPLPGYMPVTATLTVEQPQNSVGYALAPNVTDLYSTGTATLARSYSIQYGYADFVRFDPSGTVWIQNYQGTYPIFGEEDDFTLGGVTAQGTAAPPITMPTGDSFLGFDAAGRLYIASPGALTGQPIAGQPAVLVYAVGAGSALTLVRTVAVPSPPCTGAADASGRLYLATCTANGVAEYAPGVTGPSASNSTAAGPVAVDPSGDVFATYGSAIGEWTAGTFGPAAPSRLLTGLPCALSDLAVDKAGDVYALTGPACSAGNNLYYYPAGANSPTLLQQFSAAFDANYSGQHSVAAPLK